MAHSVTLRRWQKAALERLASSERPDFLAVATPGAGKTTFALTAARRSLATTPGQRLVVVAPTQHLKTQWATAALAFDLHLDPAWAAADGALPPDMHGIVTTYQQVATSAPVLRGLSTNAFVIFDEIHHAGEERAWGDAIRLAFEPAARRLSLSGTPFRSDTNPIPFVTYDEVAGDTLAAADFEYGYADALADGGVVRPVYFPRIDGRMEWMAPDGEHHAHTFDDPLDAARSSQRLRTALSTDGEWLPAVLRQAHVQLDTIRRTQPDAGGLVIAMDQDHARSIARIFRERFNVQAVVATSDDPTASTRIAQFARSTQPWIVAVRMVSEGVDIPRLRVGVFATTTTTELFFRQAVGRLVRWTRTGGQKAFLFIPDDPRLRARAFQIAEQRRHSLRKKDRPDDAPVRPEEEAAVQQELGQDEQLSLFAPISAVTLGDLPDPEPDDLHGEAAGPGQPEWLTDGDAPGAWGDEAYTVELPPMPTASRPVGPDGQPVTRKDLKKRLREANADCTRLIARNTGMTHAQVNAELNRLAGVRRITEATVEQLEVRLRHADRWLARS